MADLLWLVILGLLFLAGSRKRKKNKNKKQTVPNVPQNHSYETYSAGGTSEQPQSYPAASSSSARAEKRKAAEQKKRTVQQASAGQAAGNTAKPDIVERAKANADRLKEDETLKEIEEAHGHSEEETPIEMEHSRNCQALKNAEVVEKEVEDQLGSTEDLIVKGYSGNLEFERDFQSEAMDMLAAISAMP